MLTRLTDNNKLLRGRTLSRFQDRFGLAVIRHLTKWLIITSLSLALPATASAAESAGDLTAMSLESLMEIEITTVSKQAQSLKDTAASVYVISSEDIRRSGATTIPEALRLAPGLEIAHIDGNKVAMAIRGFNSAGSSNKLLVLIDGRVVYSALVAGVFWEHQDTLMADIDRIEVVRGPGATVWGANAVNGVINIITKHASETQGGLVEGIAGSGFAGKQGAVRYGGELGDDAHYRAYIKYMDRDEFRTANDVGANDGRQVSQGGGRIDWQPSQQDHITLQGDVYDGSEQQNVLEQPITFAFGSTTPKSGSFNESADITGGNLLFRWERLLETGGQRSFQIYYDRLEREDRLIPHSTDALDVDFQYGFGLTDQLDLTWGLGYRRVKYEFNNLPHLQLMPDSDGLDTVSGFLQGDYAITSDLGLTLGSKFEHNDFTGFEYQPSARMHWHPVQNHTLWGAISRAVRTPAIFDSFGRTNFIQIEGVPPFIPPTLFSLFGSEDLESEKLIAYELGYRAQLRRNLSFDLSLFYNEYDNLINYEPAPLPVFEPPNLLFRFDGANRLEGESYGLEVTTEWQATDIWRLTAGYSLTEISLRTDATSLDTFTAAGIEENSPEQMFQLRSYLDLPHNLEFDVSMFWVDQLPGNPTLFTQEVDRYLKLDLHLGWRPVTDLSLDLFVHNLLDDRTPEFRGSDTTLSELPRSVFGRVRWRW